MFGFCAGLHQVVRSPVLVSQPLCALKTWGKSLASMQFCFSEKFNMHLQLQFLLFTPGPLSFTYTSLLLQDISFVVSSAGSMQAL